MKLNWQALQLEMWCKKTQFKYVKIKPGRCKENWCRSTQRYYVLSWKKDTNSQSEIEFANIPSLLPTDYFVISKTQTLIKIGHLLREIVNGSKLMLEIHLPLDSHYSLHAIGKEINLDKIEIQKKYSMTSESIKLLFEIIAQLRYYFGVNILS